MELLRLIVFTAACALCAGSAQAQNLDKVRFATNWLAQAEHGGFYQALADGTYRKFGLDVTIVPGGPNANHRLLLPAGKIDFYMSANSLQAFDAVEQNIPTLVVAAIFQQDPQVFLAHPNQGINTFSDLKKLTLFVSKEGVATYFQWMKREFGFRDEQVKPYTFNPQPFLADKRSAMQGYVTSEPYAIETQARFKPQVFLLAQQGFGSYSTLIETRRDLVEKNPGLVQRFVDASIIGWMNYLYRDNRTANVRIKHDNPEMKDDLIAYAIRTMNAYAIVDFKVTREGVGSITDDRMKSFYNQMVRAGVVKAGLDYKRAYTTQFVNKGVGIELRPK
jgi:NitT/TauT family transport system substrate-binding protein